MTWPKLFIFDMDGLLLDSEVAFMNTLGDVMADYGFTMTREFYVQTVGLTKEGTRSVCARYFGENFPFDAVYAEGRRRQNQKAADHPLPVKPGIPELLSRIQSKGIPACVASSSPRRTVEIYLDTSGLLSFFDFIASGDEITRSKPDPEIFLLACNHYGISPEEAIVLEDSENGIRAAINGRIPVICIPDMKMPAEELLDQALFTCTDAFEVLKKLES